MLHRAVGVGPETGQVGLDVIGGTGVHDDLADGIGIVPRGVGVADDPVSYTHLTLPTN